jgi:hypothetical protein
MKTKLVCAFLLLPCAPAAVSAQNAVSYTSGPTASCGSVTASGTYTVACGQTGATITLYCASCGGQGGQVLATLNSCNGTWSATRPCIGSGTYIVFAQMSTVDSMLRAYPKTHL